MTGSTTRRANTRSTRSLVRAEAVDPRTWLVVNHLEGNFPGGVVDLRYQFVIADGLISELVIAP